MIIGKNRYVLFNFFPYEYRGLENYLNKMALKGWKFEKFCGYFLKFRKSEPEKIKYSVDTVEKISFLESKDSDISLEYREYCEAAGWSFVCEDGKIQVFCTKNQAGNIDIHTDEREKFNNISKASFKSILLLLISTIIFLYSQYNATLGSYDSRFLADNSQLILSGAICLFSINIFIEAISYFIWFIKASKAIRGNEKVNYKFYFTMNIRRVINKVIFMGLVIALILNIADIAIDNNLELNTNNYPLTVEDFNDVAISNDSGEGSSYIDIMNGVIADNLFYSTEGKEGELIYEFFQSKYKWAIDYKVNEVMHSAENYNITFERVEGALPENIEVYKNVKADRYLLIGDNTIIEISKYNTNQSEKELLNIVYNKVF